MRTLAIASSLFFVLAGTFVAGQGRQKQVTIWNTGVGNGNNESRPDAEAEAEQQATEEATRVCLGRVGQVRRTSTGCFPTGSGEDRVYHCIVTVKAECVLGN